MGLSITQGEWRVVCFNVYSTTHTCLLSTGLILTYLVFLHSFYSCIQIDGVFSIYLSIPIEFGHLWPFQVRTNGNSIF